MDAQIANTAAVYNVLLIFPRFNPNSFWALEDTCRIHGAKAPAPPLGLMTVAAMLPQHWNLKLVNRNVDDLSDADFGWADLVMTGGMLPQCDDAFTLIKLCRAKGIPVCVGGPDATSRPEVYDEADFLVLGEVEEIINDFVADWGRGERHGRYTAPKFQTDVTKTPIPRYDLIDPAQYLWVNMQFSRGCPFNCEFCDIIELYGRVPRTKTAQQVLAELQTLYDRGYRGHVDFVDDNLIGNKKALKKFLPVLKQWQDEHGFPFAFSTEASINLADDDELLKMLSETNFFVVFVGIESGDAETLVSMQKKQNTRRSIADSLHRIYAAGIFTVAGFILGFDTEKDGVAQDMIDIITATSVPISVVGLLTALPNTQLNRRLRKEGRMIHDLAEATPTSGDQCTAGLNFTTKRPRRDILRDYRTVLQSVYSHDAFFARLRHQISVLKRPDIPAKFNLKAEVHNLGILFNLLKEIHLHRRDLVGHFWRLLGFCLRHNPKGAQAAGSQVLMYMHVSKFTRFVLKEMDRQIAEIDANALPPEPAKVAA